MRLACLLTMLLACGTRDASTVPASDPPPAPPDPAAPADPVAAPAAPVAAPAAPAVTPAPVPPADPPVAAAATPPPPVDDGPPPAPSKTWPFKVWDRAEAITFNDVPYGPGIPLRVYDEAHGWSPKIVERKPVSADQAKRALGLVVATGGEVEVSKCAFPRHAIVFYAGQRPVGTANVCFECGDILVWPDLDPPPDYDNWTPAAEKAHAKLYKKKLAAYKKAFPQWEKLFRDELGFPLTP